MRYSQTNTRICKEGTQVFRLMPISFDLDHELTPEAVR